MILHAGGKLVSYLRGHEHMGDMLLFEVVVQGYQIQSDSFWDNIYTGPGGQCRIEIHHASIKPIAGIGSHAVGGF